MESVEIFNMIREDPEIPLSRPVVGARYAPKRETGQGQRVGIEGLMDRGTALGAVPQ